MWMQVRLSVVLIAVGAAVAGPAAAGSQRSPDPGSPVGRALAFFAGPEAHEPDVLLRRLRPAPLSLALRAAVVAALPPEGELQPTEAEREKIAALEPVFDLHERNGLIVIKVIDVGHAFVGLHAKAVLLLSRDALSLVSAQQLQALAAHELGHEMFWDEYEAARVAGGQGRLQELELRCDGVAVTTLRGLGRGPQSLIDAVTKMTRHNERLRAVGSASRYVSLRQRRHFIEAVAAILDLRTQQALVRLTP
jgi:hypothetical protein